MYRTSLTLRWPAQRLQSGDAVVGSLDSLGGHMDCGGGILILVAHTGVKGDAGEQRGGALTGADGLVAVEVAVAGQRPVGGVEVRLYQRGIRRAVAGEAGCRR